MAQTDAIRAEEAAQVPHASVNWRLLAMAAQQEAAQMREAMDSRAAIEQAKGVIMTRTHCSADEAFAVLRDASQRSNRKLRDVALLIVADCMAKTTT